MTTDDFNQASLPAPPAAFEDIPVLVRVEIATLTLSARECAQLTAGDVLRTGVRLGQLVSLRTGGVVVARGELCELDGDLALRILETQQGDS